MTILQVMVIAVVCTVATAPDGIVLPDRTGDWVSVLYMAVDRRRARPARPDLGAGPPAAHAQRASS